MRFAALRAPWYKGYLAGGSLLMGGDQVEHAITYFAMWQLFQSPLLAGFAIVSHWLPHLLFSVISGGLADRYDCRRIVQIGAGLLALSSIGWATALALGILEPWMCMVFLVIHGMASAVWSPAQQLMLYDLVGPKDLPSGVRLMATGMQIGSVIGPVIGAVLLFTVGPVIGLYLNVLMYVPFIVYLFRVPFDGHTRGRREVARFNLRETFSVLRELPKYPVILLVVILQGSVAMLFGNAVMPLLPAFGESLGVGDSGLAYGLLLSAMAAGAVTGGITLESIGRIRPTLWISTGAVLVLAICIVAFSFSGSYVIALPALFVMGLATLVATSTSQSIVQLEAPEGKRGRFVGVYGTTSMGLRVVSGLVVGAIASWAGAQWGLGIPAAILGMVALVLIAWMTVRHFRTRAVAVEPSPVIEEL